MITFVDVEERRSTSRIKSICRLSAIENRQPDNRESGIFQKGEPAARRLIQ
jgi:hypothetical protein